MLPEYTHNPAKACRADCTARRDCFQWYDCRVGAAEERSARVDDPRTWPADIQQRYGLPARPRRGLWIVLVVVVLFTSPLAVRFAWRSGTEQGVLTMPTHAVISDSVVRLQLSYPGRDRDFICAVRGQDYDRQDVGYAYLPLPAGPARNWEYTLRTRQRAVTASVIACQPGTDPDRLPAPQFPPGVKPPDQAPPGFAPRASGGFATVRP